ncbi:MAG TPA: YdeI/OmpD-associated family protein [Tepidisphaeraceae bacterium]|jgi:uncharacterized protein YdeI (YjbR/CyaY-like superfamily)
MKNLETLDVPTRRHWRDWLRANHDSVDRIWLVFHKRHTGRGCMSYDESVEEALCFGWIDSLIRRLDEERYARLFTPRKADSRWSTINRRRYARLKARGLLEAPGLKRPPTARSGDAPQVSVSALPPDIEMRLKDDPRAWSCFQQLAPSHRRQYLMWIESAKRQETKEKRLRQAIERIRSGEKPGLK